MGDFHRLLLYGTVLFLSCRIVCADPVPGLKTYTAGQFQADAAFVPDKTEIKVREPLWVTEHLYNCGSKPFKFEYIGSLAWWNLRVIVLDPFGHNITHTPTSLAIEQVSGSKIVAPGSEAVEHALVTTYSPIVSPGIYTVTCERDIVLASPVDRNFFSPILNLAPKSGSSSMLDVVSTFTVRVDP